MKLIRIFVRKTTATPVDENVIINRLPNLFDEADQIHISVTFTWDISRAEELYKKWRVVAPVLMGGPAFNERGGEFTPGLYLKEGYTITSRGCHNKCWFCKVWKREITLSELQVKDGWNIVDDNLLACSEDHRHKVFEMLKRQKYKPKFTGGLEAKLMTMKIATELRELKPEIMYFAYDTPDDLLPLIQAGEMLREVGFGRSHHLACYILIGFPNDTTERALIRIKQVIDAGFFPFAMLWRNENGDFKREWKQFQRQWANPVISAANCKKYLNNIK